VASEVSFAEAKNASANISITAEEIPTQGNVGGRASEDFEVIDDDLGLPF
jgi:hypothetical protein